MLYLKMNITYIYFHPLKVFSFLQTQTLTQKDEMWSLHGTKEACLFWITRNWNPNLHTGTTKPFCPFLFLILPYTWEHFNKREKNEREYELARDRERESGKRLYHRLTTTTVIPPLVVLPIPANKKRLSHWRLYVQ